ncbi:hypothetical protein H0H92_002983 [Tricholoma furcatifolium]|nr:hypothetical protein H0H92_002983 [Tricholoma furcatifolium]
MFWQTFVLLGLCYTASGIHITNDPNDVLNKTFSYVVVGGGTAGLTVASRLAEDLSTTILVIEAGPNAQNDTLVNDPGQSSPAAVKYDWGYNTTSQTVGGNVLHLTQGKVLGGSSSINGMCWTRGTIDQYDSLEKLGNPGWNFETLMRYMKKAERYHLPNQQQAMLGATANPAVHGLDGNVNVGFPQPYEAAVVTQNITEAFQAAIPGLITNIDLASGIPNGVARFQFSIKPGNNTVITPGGNTRSSSADSFIYPFLQEQPNLTILTGYYATTIVWGQRVGNLSHASGVRFISTPVAGESLGPEFQVQTSREVIVASGAIGVDLAAVGTNLQDQALNVNVFSVPPTIPTPEYTIINGPLSPAVAFLDIAQVLGNDSARVAGNELLQTVTTRAKDIVASGAFTSESGLVKILQIQANSIVNLKAPVIEMSTIASQPSNGEGVIGTDFWNLIPQWRGTVHVQSKDPSVLPLVDPRYYTGADFDLLLKGNATRISRELFSTSPLSGFAAEEVIPGLALPDNATDAEVQAYVISSYLPVFHPIGTVPMLPQEDGGAVGPNLVVYGTTNVRVIAKQLANLV